MNKLYDITLPLSTSTAVWPGDVPFSLNKSLSIDAGDTVNLSSITLSVHSGTHIDAPLHILADGDGAEAFDLSACMGPAEIVDLCGKSIISCKDIAERLPQRAERVLIKTCAWKDRNTFPTDLPVIDPGLPEYLQSLGVRLFGLDIPSVDPVDSKDLQIHKQLLRCGITILESLYLDETPAGSYELTALPLKIVGADGAPVRAVLKG